MINATLYGPSVPPDLNVPYVRGTLVRIGEMSLMPKKKMAKAAVKKAHSIARKIAKAGGKVRNAYAVGMAVEKRRLAKKKRAKKR